MSIARVHYVKSARQRFARDNENVQRVLVTSKRTGQPKVGRGGLPMTRRVRKADTSRPLPNHTCGKCGVEIRVGDPYRYAKIGFRGGITKVRCTKSACDFRQSELESSALSDVYAAVEDANDAIDAVGWTGSQQDVEGELQQALQGVADTVDEVASTYREADEAFGGQGATEHAERADALEDFSSALQSFSLQASVEGCGDEWHEDTDQPEPDTGWDSHDEPEDGCEACDTKVEEFLDAARQEARDVLEELSL